MTHALPRGISLLAPLLRQIGEGLLPCPAVYVSTSSEKVLRAPRDGSTLSIDFGAMWDGWLSWWLARRFLSKSAYITLPLSPAIPYINTINMPPARCTQTQLTDVVRAPVYHSAGSKTLGKMARASSSTSSTWTSSPSISASPSPHPSIEPSPSHIRPADANGVNFPVDFNRVYHGSNRLNASRLGYRVRHKAQLAGRKDLAAIWLYGVALQYLETNGSTTKYWLCRKCHETGATPDALRVDGTAHVVSHMIRKHQIDPKIGLRPDVKPPPDNLWAAARIAGSSTFTAHTPWEEDKLQASLIDWVIVNDVLFTTATSPST